MINRRIVIAGAAALAFSATAVSAQEWKTKYSELTFAVVPAENASGRHRALGAVHFLFEQGTRREGEPPHRQ